MMAANLPTLAPAQCMHPSVQHNMNIEGRVYLAVGFTSL
jgi:hypothetical protein